MSSEDMEKVKQMLISYSANVKMYAKWFDISEVDKNEETFTTYKVIYRFLPKDLNESIKELTVWKRFRDFKELYTFMSTYHNSLHRKEKFPEFVKSTFFGRFENKVIEERRQSALRLLQFIGSQSHLYKHEKFIEFLSDGTFDDLSSSKQTEVLKPSPIVSSSSSSISTSSSNKENTNEPLGLLKQIKSQLNEFMSENEQVLRVDLKHSNLHKSLDNLGKFLNMTIVNLNSDYSFAGNKFLKLTLDTFYELDSVLEQTKTQSIKSEFDWEKLEKIIKKSINELKSIKPSDQCSNVTTTNKNKTNSNSQKEEQKETSNSMPSSTQSNILNDWILSDFNLLSNDFNNELSLISGTLFELNFNYKPHKVLNSNCILVKQRQATPGQPIKQLGNQIKFILKRLQKSSNPSVIKRSIVPFGKSVPFMCQLSKYYENENTIFLLLEYHPFGKLVSYLTYLAENGSAFLKNLNEFQKELKKYKQLKQNGDQHRRCSFSLEQYKCESEMMNEEEDVHRRRSKSLRAATQVNANSFASDEQSSRTKSLLTEILLDQIEFIDDFNENKETFYTKNEGKDSSSSSLSSSELSSSTNSTSEKQIEFPNLELRVAEDNTNKIDQQKEETNTKWSKKILSNPFKLFNTTKKKDSLIASYKSTPNFITNIKAAKQTDVYSDIKQENKYESDPYYVQIRLWLAQLLCALKSLHKLGIVCQDLRLDNLLLSAKGHLNLTYTSRWNLVDESLNKESISNYYCAPELVSLVNHSIAESCDLWSFGVIAYEMLTKKKFSELHNDVDVHSNNIRFPTDFECQLAKDLLLKLLKCNPNERINMEATLNHPFFASIDWLKLEEAF